MGPVMEREGRAGYCTWLVDVPLAHAMLTPLRTADMTSSLVIEGENEREESEETRISGSLPVDGEGARVSVTDTECDWVPIVRSRHSGTKVRKTSILLAWSLST